MSVSQKQSATPDRFLADHEAQRNWTLPPGIAGFEPVAAFDGRGTFALEVVLATSGREPSAALVRDLWAKRHGNAPNPLLAVIAFREDDRWHASLCGPAGDQPPVIGTIELGQAERLAEAALAEPSRHAALRFLTAMLPEVGADLPGLRNHGMFASHELRDRVPTRPGWNDLCEQARPLLSHRGRDLIERLGFRVEEHGTTTSVLAAGEHKRAVAVFLDEGEVFEEPTLRFEGASPVAHALAAADRENLPWAVLTRGRQIRVYSARPDVGVGRKGRAETFVEANLALLPDEQAGYLPLLFSAEALLPGGSFEQVLEESRDYATDLSTRLRDRVYKDAVPLLATALATRRGDATLDEVYDQALNVLFRLLFVAYAEDKDLLPYRSNGLYRERSLKALARHLADRRQEGALVFDGNDTSLWDDVVGLWRAVDVGNVELGVPAYNGGLFSSDPRVNPAGAALAEVSLSNAEFGSALSALIVDETSDGVVGPVDFRSLSVREFGTIYEGLLESNLSIAPSDLTLDAKANYVPAHDEDEVIVAEGEVYFHNRSGARKATGSYFTKPFAVEHLLDHALEPTLDDHVARLGELLDAGEEAKAAQAFFDFRCVDLAMGSGHFLVAAVDRVEARLSAFLAQRPIPQLTAELDRLRAAAYDALGPLGEGIEIEQTSLLRRQVARRCVYGVDRNRIAVELARLAMWIHTFVPGLPLSFLDHALVDGDSLTGIGTIDEAADALDTGDDTRISIFREPILELLSRAETALQRMARLSDATAAEIKDARAAQAEAQQEVGPARDLFDLIVAARLGKAELPTTFEPEVIAAHPQLAEARRIARELRCLHFPITFPEVFLRENAGFNCVLGNPPWDKPHVEEHSFWSLRHPGLRGLPPAQYRQQLARLREARPDLVELHQQEVAAAEELREALVRGPYPGMGEGHPDSYKAFAWRFWQLLADRGRVGVVLPRSALSAAGSAEWRHELLRSASFEDTTLLVNTGGWVFDDAEHRYTIALLSIARGGRDCAVTLSRPYTSYRSYVEGRRSREVATFRADEIESWTDTAAFPLLPHPDAAEVLRTLKQQPRFDEQRWRLRPVQGDINATTGRNLYVDERPDVWPVFSGASFSLWQPETGEVYAYVDADAIQATLQERRLRQNRNRRSAFSELPRHWATDAATLPSLYPRIAFRDVARATDSRTVIAALVPPCVVLTHKAPFLLRTRGDERDEAFLLGVLSSIPLDWYARRFVEITLSFQLLETFPIPAPDRDDPVRREVEQIAATLAAVDERYHKWASTVGVGVNTTPAAETEELKSRLDAAVARLYGLDERAIRVIFETFHVGWDFRPRLARVLDHFRALA